MDISVQPMPDGGSYVYFFAHASEPLVKIGKANCWESRFPMVGGDQLIDADKSYIKRVCSEREAFDLEFMLHALFREKRSPLSIRREGYTEWFCSSVMVVVLEIVRGLESIQGVPIRSKSIAEPAKWTGEAIDHSSITNQEAADAILRHCSVWIDGLTVFMVVKSEGFQWVMQGLIARLHKALSARESTLPAFADFPEKPWTITVRQEEFQEMTELFGLPCSA